MFSFSPSLVVWRLPPPSPEAQSGLPATLVHRPPHPRGHLLVARMGALHEAHDGTGPSRRLLDPLLLAPMARRNRSPPLQRPSSASSSINCLGLLEMNSKTLLVDRFLVHQAHRFLSRRTAVEARTKNARDTDGSMAARKAGYQILVGAENTVSLREPTEWSTGLWSCCDDCEVCW